MKNSIAVLGAAFIAAATGLLPAPSPAALVRVDFTASYQTAAGVGGNAPVLGTIVAPFGTPAFNSTNPYPFFAGSFVFDDAVNSVAPFVTVSLLPFLEEVSLQTGTMMWTAADAAAGTEIRFNQSGLVDRFTLVLLRDPGFSAIVASSASFAISDRFGEKDSACNGCVTFTVSTVPAPAALALMATSIASLGFIARRRRTLRKDSAGSS